MNPEQFRARLIRPSKIIAAEILDFPLDKPVEERFIGEKITCCEDSETFERYLNQSVRDLRKGADSLVGMGKGLFLAEKNPFAVFRSSLDDYEQLSAGLSLLWQGRETSDKQKKALDKALPLLEAFAQANEYIAEVMRGLINPVPGSADDRLLQEHVEAMVKHGIEPDTTKEDHRCEYTDKYYKFSNCAKNLRQIEPLFVELAEALKKEEPSRVRR